jgi:hypothetical protein
LGPESAVNQGVCARAVRGARQRPPSLAARQRSMPPSPMARRTATRPHSVIGPALPRCDGNATEAQRKVRRSQVQCGVAALTR